jgi:UMF1 family MFS transporter
MYDWANSAYSTTIAGATLPAHFTGTVFSKFSAMWGPLLFALISGAAGSGRPAILAIIVFFVAGFLVLRRVDIDAARRSRDLWVFTGDGAGAAEGDIR